MKKLVAVLSLLICFSTANALSEWTLNFESGLSNCAQLEDSKFYPCVLEETIKIYDKYVAYQNTCPTGRRGFGHELADVQFMRTKAKQRADNKAWTFLEFLNNDLNHRGDLADWAYRRASTQSNYTGTTGHKKYKNISQAGIKKTLKNFAYNLNCDKQGQSCRVTMFTWNRSMDYVANNPNGH